MASATLHLSPVLDATAAGPLKQNLLAHTAEALSVDASAVERISTLCLQLLLSAARTWMAAGLDFRVTGESQAFTDARTLLGITTQQLPMGSATP